MRSVCGNYVYPKLIVSGNGTQTVRNLITHQTLFAVLITGYAITFICDIVAAWALYILLKPVNVYLSGLTALFRLVFAIVAIVSLLNLTNTFRMITAPDYLNLFKTDQLAAQVMLSANAFRTGFHFGLLFFGIYLGLLGYLVWRLTYIPSILGLLLAISGLGYFATSLQPYLFPGINISFATYTFFGELIFMFWLIIRGWRIQKTYYSGAVVRPVS